MTVRKFDFESDADQRDRFARQNVPGLGAPNPGAFISPAGLVVLTGTQAGAYMEALGRASSDSTTGLVAVDDGESNRIATDELGRLWVRPLAPTPTEAASAYVSKNYEKQATPLAVPGVVIGLRMLRTINLAAADRWLMVFDAAAPVANNAIPIWRSLLPSANANLASECWDDPPIPFAVTAGITVAMSTTDLILTLPAANEALFGVLFR